MYLANQKLEVHLLLGSGHERQEQQVHGHVGDEIRTLHVELDGRLVGAVGGSAECPSLRWSIHMSPWLCPSAAQEWDSCQTGRSPAPSVVRSSSLITTLASAPWIAPAATMSRFPFGMRVRLTRASPTRFMVFSS